MNVLVGHTLLVSECAMDANFPVARIRVDLCLPDPRKQAVRFFLSLARLLVLFEQ